MRTLAGGTSSGARREDDDGLATEGQVPNIDDAEGEVEVPEEVNKGTKRKSAPRTKGPCEHGVKYRSNCKVCSACPHGRRRSQCKESAVGHKYASTVVSALYARSAVGDQSASTVVSALSARSARSSERIINQTNIF